MLQIQGFFSTLFLYRTQVNDNNIRNQQLSEAEDKYKISIEKDSFEDINIKIEKLSDLYKFIATIQNNDEKKSKYLTEALTVLEKFEGSYLHKAKICALLNRPENCIQYLDYYFNRTNRLSSFSTLLNFFEIKPESIKADNDFDQIRNNSAFINWFENNKKTV
jgi:hypothetical protein